MRSIALALSLIFQLSAVHCAADSVEKIRTEWSALRATPSPAFGHRLNIAPDAYCPRPERPADRDRAEHLYALARRAAEQGEAALALRLATDAVQADTDFESARRVLGYERYEDRWLTSYQLRMAKRGKQWHDEFGWIEPEDLSRYEAGERKQGRVWVPAEIDARKHSDIAKGWQIRTDHFAVTTNHSLSEAARLAGRLEELFQVWRQLFADFYIDDGELSARFEKSRVPGVRSRPFQVVLHRNREQYVRHLITRQPRIAETIGIYFDREREAHFFVAAEASSAGADATLYHEAVHQLFQESERKRREAGGGDNFWAIEGVATYFESLGRHADNEYGVYFTIGEPNAGRLPAARQRLLEEGYRVPLAELVLLGKGDLQTRRDLAPLYSQAAGLATFFMADDELRPAFAEYLKRLYAGRTEPATLAELTGKTYAELDAKYRAFLSGSGN